jgi:RNA polymerase sigma-54 factor
VARRTVAKYRDSLRIPSSVERRKLKMAPARDHVRRHNSVVVEA